MGFSLEPTLANAFLCHFEKQWLSVWPQDFGPNILRRYVDYIFVTFKSHNQLKKFVYIYKIVFCIYILNCFFIITSSSRQFHNKIDALKQIFKLSRYSIQFADRCMKQFLQKFYLTRAAQDTVNKKQLLIVLPFLGSQSFLVRKVYKVG